MGLKVQLRLRHQRSHRMPAGVLASQLKGFRRRNLQRRSAYVSVPTHVLHWAGSIEGALDNPEGDFTWPPSGQISRDDLECIAFRSLSNNMQHFNCLHACLIYCAVSGSKISSKRFWGAVGKLFDLPIEILLVCQFWVLRNLSLRKVEKNLQKIFSLLDKHAKRARSIN